MKTITLEEVVEEIDEIALSRVTSINGVLVQMWDRNVLTAYIEQKAKALADKRVAEEKQRLNALVALALEGEEISGRANFKLHQVFDPTDNKNKEI